jgi:hypothetical protein
MIKENTASVNINEVSPLPKKKRKKLNQIKQSVKR